MTRAVPPERTGARWSEHAIEQVIGRLLQIGVLIAAAVVLGGGTALIVRHGGDPANFHTFRGAASPLRDLAAITSGVRRLDSRAIVQLGLVLLIATPIARVALTLVAFLVRRDWLYVVLTGVVLVLLVVGLTWTRA